MKNIIEIEGRYFKECSVVMLPTKEGKLIQMINTKDLHYCNVSKTEQQCKSCNHIAQHIHITSDDEIKKSDYFIYFTHKSGYIIKQCAEIVKVSETEVIITCTDHEVIGAGIVCKKIIATIDESLTHIKGSIQHLDSIARPSQSFIKAFVKVGGIDKVLVEYIEKDYIEIEKELGIYGHDEGLNERELKEYSRNNSLYKLKTDSHNTITIKKVKDYATNR